jgi:hypothetical protein
LESMTKRKPMKEARGRPEEPLVISGPWENAVSKALKAPPVPKETPKKGQATKKPNPKLGR